jgi:hypothetical protein
MIVPGGRPRLFTSLLGIYGGREDSREELEEERQGLGDNNCCPLFAYTGQVYIDLPFPRYNRYLQQICELYLSNKPI